MQESERKYPKEIYLLMLLDANKQEPIKGRTRLQKLMFLLEKEIIEKKELALGEENYLFEAYNYGPFSYELLDDIMFLRDLNLIRISPHINPNENEEYVITEKGHKIIKQILQNAEKNNQEKTIRLYKEIERLKKQWNNKDLRVLLYYVYNKYSSYTVRSEIREALLGH